MHNKAALAAIAELTSEKFVNFSKNLFRISNELGLGGGIGWSKLWEYPWVTFNGLPLEKQRILDIGSEMSAMPWYMAQCGAHVTMIDVDPQYMARWEHAKSRCPDVDFQIVKDEALPFPESSFDCVTSFSVIEHQPNKEKAISEVVRVLKPGGIFGLSFDICEPWMKYPRPEEQPFSMASFESLVWFHPAFENKEKPAWNLGDIPKFMEWHLKTAAHHTYVTGAAILQCLK
jgi:2-polyprenyl-3-methyl-5-hydroxy-6-metoxy-1,4-benzoquinol methylase